MTSERIMRPLIHPKNLHLFQFSRLKPHCKHVVFNSIVLHTVYVSPSLSLSLEAVAGEVGVARRLGRDVSGSCSNCRGAEETTLLGAQSAGRPPAPLSLAPSVQQPLWKRWISPPKTPQMCARHCGRAKRTEKPRNAP